MIVIDPLLSAAECAAAALTLYRRHRGDRPVTGMACTHSHPDHYGGVPVIATQGFLEHAVSEMVLAGPAMSRRAAYMYAPHYRSALWDSWARDSG